jgi:hypothetical protein
MNEEAEIRMRDTAYATEIATASVSWGDSEGRIERLRIKDSGEIEIRFSWWKDGRLAPRPLDLNEDDLLVLMERAVAADVFTAGFRTRMKELL